MFEQIELPELVPYSTTYDAILKARPMENHEIQSPTNTSTAEDDGNWALDANALAKDFESLFSTPINNLLNLANELVPLDNIDTYVLDIGKGMGAIATSLYEKYPNAPILGADLSNTPNASQLELRNLSNVQTIRVNAVNLGPTLENAKATGQASGFSHVFSAFMVQSTAYPTKIIAEMLQVTKPGGVLGLATWGKRNDWEITIYKALVEIDPSYKGDNVFDEHVFPRSVEEVVDYMRELGLRDMKATTLLVHPPFPSPESYVSYLVDGKNDALEKLYRDWDRNHAGDRDQIKSVMRELVVKESRWKDVRIEVILFGGRKT